MLTVKAQEQEETILNYVEKENVLKELQIEYKKMKEVVDTMNSDKMQMIEDKKELSGKVLHLKNEKIKALKDKDYLIGILSDATFVLNEALQVGILIHGSKASFYYGSSIADTVLKSAGSATPPTPPVEITIAI